MFGRMISKESGAIVVGGRHIGSTQQCVHCGKHEMVIPGSGKKRGWCHYCKGFLCGKEICKKCVPYEAQLEYAEAVQAKNQATLNKLISRYPDIARIQI